MNFKVFINFAVISLSIMLGTLLALPLLSTGMPAVGLILGGVFGGLIGYRRRDSRLFLYFLLGGILIVATLYATQM